MALQDGTKACDRASAALASNQLEEAERRLVVEYATKIRIILDLRDGKLAGSSRLAWRRRAAGRPVEEHGAEFAAARAGLALLLILPLCLAELTVELVADSPGQILSSITIEAMPAEVTLAVGFGEGGPQSGSSSSRAVTRSMAAAGTSSWKERLTQ